MPKYLLLMPLAWALNAAPHNMATGVAADYGMLAAALVTAGWIIWRDRPRAAWHTVTAGLLFASMIAWSGHDSVLIGVAVVLLAVMLVRAITGHLRRPHAGGSPRPSRASSRSASHTAEAPAKPRTRNGANASGHGTSAAQASRELERRTTVRSVQDFG